MKIRFKKFLTQITAIAVIFWSLGPTVFIGSLPADAAITVFSAVASAGSAQTIARSTSAAVLGLNIVGTGDPTETIDVLNVAISPSANFTMGDLASMGPCTTPCTGTSGISLYRDDGGTQGAFDGTDTNIPLGNIGVTNGSTRFSKLVPSDSVTTDGTSQVIGSGGRDINLAVGDIVFGRVNANATSLAVHNWHVVTTAQNFTTDAAPSTLRLDGNATGAPTFAANSRFSKLTPNQTSSFVIGTATATITETGSYDAPAVGDMVFFQKGSDAGQWGIVTNATLTNGSNVFAINFEALTVSSTYLISKISSLMSTFTVGTANATITEAGNYDTPTVGDVVLYRAEAGGPSASWGIVTNATLANGSGVFAIGNTILMQGAYQIAKVNAYTPTSSLTSAIPVGGSGQEIVFGDLLFGLPTLNPVSVSYGWHVSTGDTSGGADLLRLDDRLAAPIFGFSVMFDPIGEFVMANDTGNNAGADFHIVFRTSGTAVNGHAFTVAVAPGTFSFSPGLLAGLPNKPDETVSATITIDANIPTIKAAFAQPDPATGLLKEIMVFFSEPMLASSLSCIDANSCALKYTVSGPITVNSAAPFMAGTSSDNIRLTLASPAVNGLTTLTPTANQLVDLAGGAVASVASTLRQVFPPFIKGARRIDAQNIAVKFSNDMKSATTNTTASYAVTTAAADNEAITTATLGADLRTVTVNLAGATIVNGDTMSINSMQNFQDIAGAPAQGQSFFPIDGVKPRVVGAFKEDNPSGNDYVYVRFSEPVDRSVGEVAGNYTPNAGTISAAQILFFNSSTSPSWMTPEMSDRVAKLTTPNVAAITNDVTVSTNVTDMAGNAMDNAGNANVASFAALVSITISNTGVAADPSKGSFSTWLDGCGSNFEGPNKTGFHSGNGCADLANDANRDTITIPFTGSIDTAALGEDGNGIIRNISSFVEMFRRNTYIGSAQTCFPGDFFDANLNQCVQKMHANLNASYARVIDTEANNFTANTNNIIDDVLVIYLQGETMIERGMEVNPVNIRGLNGQPAGLNATASKNQLPVTAFPTIEFVKVNKANGNATIIDGGDTVTFFFSADMNRTNIPDGAVLGTVLRPKGPRFEDRIWGGAGLAIAWGNHNGATCTAGGTSSDSVKDCLIVTRGADLVLNVGTYKVFTVSEGDFIKVDKLYAANGLPIEAIIDVRIDTIAPTAIVIMNTITNVVAITFSEELRENDGTPGNYTDNVTYNGAGGATNAARDAAYNLDGFTAGLKATNEATTFIPTGGLQRIRKLFIKLNATPEVGDVISFSNLIDPGATLPANANPAADAIAPTICRIKFFDHNGDAKLSATEGFEVEFDNETPANAANGCVSDVDSATLTDLNVEFIVKRGGNAVPNAFGLGAKINPSFEGGFFVNLGMGADIQAGDEIWAVANEIKDLTGNAMNAAAAQYTLPSLRGGEITKIIFTNTDASVNPMITHGDTVKIIFSSAINTTNPNLPIRDAGVAIRNIDEGLWLDHNFEANYSANYVFAKKSWGKDSTGAWGNGNTEFTITVNCAAGGSVTACDPGTTDAQFGDKDVVIPHFELLTSTGSSVRSRALDITGPQLFKVFGNRGLAGGTGTWDAGDKIIFLFNEPMDQATLTLGNLATLANELNPGADGSIVFGAGTAAFLDPDRRVLEVTLGANPTVTDTTAFNPDASVKDLNGSMDATPANVVLTVTTLASVTNVLASDGDTVQPGIDGRDLTITWSPSPGATQYKLYLLPLQVSFDPFLHGPIAIPTSSACVAQCSFTGTSALLFDSRSMNAQGAVDTTKPKFFLNFIDDYQVFIMASSATEDAFPVRAAQNLRLTEEYGNDGQAPNIVSSDPQSGAKEIATNRKRFSLAFNEAMKRENVEGSGKIKLQKKVNTVWTDATAFISYNTLNHTATVESQANLDANTDYRIAVTTGVTDVGGAPIALQYETYFTTSAGTDAIPPKVEKYFFDGQTLPNLTAVSRATQSIVVALNESLDATFVTSANVTLSPAVQRSSVTYEASPRSIRFNLGSQLEAGVAYTLTLSGSELRDIAGNKLDGDQNGTANGTSTDNYTLSFTASGAALSTTQPTIQWADSNTNTIRIGFSDKMDLRTVTDNTKWSVTPATADLRTASFKYINDPFRNELIIEGVNGLTSGAPYTLVPDPSILGLNGQQINLAGSTLPFTPQSKAAAYDRMALENTARQISIGSAFDGDLYNKIATDNFAYDRDIKNFLPVRIEPRSRTAGKRTNYFISFPATKAIPNDGKVILKFPATFDLTNAAVAKDSNNILPGHNQDINKDEGTMTAGTTFNSNGKVQITGIAINSEQNTLTLTLGVDDGTGCTLDRTGDDETPVTNGTLNATDNIVYGEFKSNCTDTNQNSTTKPGDFFEFELSGIKNGEAAEIDWRTGGSIGGYEIEIETRNSAFKHLEGPIKSQRFDILKGGNGSISGTVTAQDGSTPIANARVGLMSPSGGFETIFTGTDGKYNFTQLSVAESDYAWDGTHDITIDAPSANDLYFGLRSIREIRLTAAAPSATGKNAKLDSAEHTVTFTINFSASLTNKDVLIGFNGNISGKEKRVTLTDTDGNPANGLAVTNATLKVPSGSWSFTIRPYVEELGYGVSRVEQNFRLLSTQKSVSGATAVSFTLQMPTNIVSGVVKDQNGNGLPNVAVYAASFKTTTSSDGSYAFELPNGSFPISVSKSGLKRVPDKFITLNDANMSGIDFVMIKQAQSISGRAMGRNNVALKNATVLGIGTASDGKRHNVDAQTDENGNYTLYLDPGAWTISAQTEKDGSIPADTGVTVTSINVASSQNITEKNFSLSATATTSYASVKGRIADLSGNPVANAMVFYEKKSFVNGVAGNSEGNGTGTFTDPDGNFTFNLKKSTTGTATGASRYTFEAFVEGNQVKPDANNFYDIQADTTGLNFTVATKRKMTVSIVNGDQLEVGAVDINRATMSLRSVTSNNTVSRTFRDVGLTNGDQASVGTIPALQGGGYSAEMKIEGVGNFACTSGGSATFAITADATVQCDLGLDAANAVNTLTGTVRDTLNATIPGAAVSVVNSATSAKIGVFKTNTNGAYTIKVPDGNYTISANKKNYNSPSDASVSGNDANRVITMASSQSTITALVKLNGVTVKDAFVWAEQVGGNGREYASLNPDTGLQTLSVPSNTTWKLFASDPSGNQGITATAITAGTANVEVALTTTVVGQSKINVVPTVQGMTPKTGGRVDDSDATGMMIDVPGGTFGSGETPGTIRTQETAAIPTDNSNKPFGGVGKEFTFTDSNGQDITEFPNDMTITLTYKKEKTESFSEAANTKSSNGLEELNQLQNSYLDESTQTYVPIPTTKRVIKKDQSSDQVFTEVDFATFVTNVTGEGTNPQGGGTQKDYYYDYEVQLESQTNHATIFAPIVPSDVVAPAVPAALAVSAASGSASLTWTQNAEADLLEYEIYRGTVSDFTCSNATQINTTSTGKVGIFNDTTVGTATYSYFYKITAADTSGNESTCTSAVVANFTSLTSGSGGSGGTAIVSGTGGSAAAAVTTPAKAVETTPSAIAVQKPVAATPAVPAVPATFATPSKPALKSGSTATKTPVPAKLAPVNRPLVVGSEGSDVKTLQQVMKADGCYKGSIDGVLDATDIKAIKCFQVAHKLAKPGVRGYGTVGPATRAAVNAIVEQASKTAVPAVPATPATPAKPAQPAAKPVPAKPTKEEQVAMKAAKAVEKKEALNVAIEKASEALEKRYTSENELLGLMKGAKAAKSTAKMQKKATLYVKKLTSVLEPKAIKAVLKDLLLNLPEPVKKIGMDKFATALAKARKAHNNAIPQDPVGFADFVQEAMNIATGNK